MLTDVVQDNRRPNVGPKWLYVFLCFRPRSNAAVESTYRCQEEQLAEVTHTLISTDPSSSNDQFIKNLLADVIGIDQATASVPNNNADPTAEQSVSFAQLVMKSVMPKSCKPVKRLRQVQHAAIVTSSPYKKSLEATKETTKTVKHVNDERLAKRGSTEAKSKSIRKGKAGGKKTLTTESRPTNAIDCDDEDLPLSIVL